MSLQWNPKVVFKLKNNVNQNKFKKRTRENKIMRTSESTENKAAAISFPTRAQALPAGNTEIQHINSIMQRAKGLLYFLVIAQIECAMPHSPLMSVPRRPEMMSNRSVQCLMTWLKETAQMVTMWPGHLHMGEWPCCSCFWFQIAFFFLSLRSCNTHTHYAPIHTYNFWRSQYHSHVLL